MWIPNADPGYQNHADADPQHCIPGMSAGTGGWVPKMFMSIGKCSYRRNSRIWGDNSDEARQDGSLRCSGAR